MSVSSVGVVREIEMQAHLLKITRLVFIAWVIPFFVMYATYFGYVSAMSLDMFTFETFTSIYENGVFRYRIVPKFLLDSMYDAIIRYSLPARAPDTLYLLYPGTDEVLFSAFFYLNFLFLGLTLSTYFVLLQRLCPAHLSIFVDVSLLAILGLVAVTQFVVVPYDTLSYFCIAVAMYVTILPPRNFSLLYILIPTLLLAALTRETAALILSFVAGWHYRELLNLQSLRVGLQSPLGKLVALTLFYVAIYVALRLIIPSENLVFTGNRLADNLVHQFSKFGYVFLFCGIVCFCLLPAARRECMIFVLFSLPYIAMISVISNPREYRLFVPIFVPMLVMQLVKALQAYRAANQAKPA